MREIKYRIWDEKVKRYVQDHDDFFIDPDGELHTINICEGEDRFCSPERYIIEQYTGLKDKHSTKIYEGDIIESGVAKMVVEFYDFTMRLKRLDVKNSHDIYLLKQISCEIIGNIHDVEVQE